MKFLKLSTTSKLYLLTLVFIFAIIILNQSVFAQSQPSSTTQKRLAIMERYNSWISSNEYGQFKTELGNKVLTNFKTFLFNSLAEDKSCLMPRTPSRPGFVENIQNFLSGLISQTPQPVAQTQLSGCKGKIKDDYKLAKKYNRALKYLQIEEGQPNTCVKADLGVGKALKAKGFNPAKTDSDNPKETGMSEPLQVYLCTGNDGKKKVRVVDDSGTRLRLAPEEAAKPEFKVENLPPKGSLETLLGKLGIE